MLGVCRLRVAPTHTIVEMLLIRRPQALVVQAGVPQAFAQVFQELMQFLQLLRQRRSLHAAWRLEEHLIAAVRELADLVTHDNSRRFNFYIGALIHQYRRAALAHRGGLRGALAPHGHTPSL